MTEISPSITLLTSAASHNNLSKKILSVAKEEYFEAEEERALFNVVFNYVEKFHNLPPREAILIELGNLDRISETAYQKAKAVCDYMYSQEALEFIFNSEEIWLQQQIEAFCKNRALYLAITKSIEIIDESPDKKTKLDRGVIPKLLQDALAISMDMSVGHDYLNDAEARYDKYVEPEQKIKTGVHMFDKVLNGGLVRKSLTVLLGGTGSGKSMTLCSFSASLMMQGYNVLYISLEMPEHVVGRRIDANLLNIDYDKIEFVTKSRYTEKMEALRKSGIGSIVIKDYPPSSVGSTQFRALVQELKVKRGFIPDVIVLDYLAIAAPSTIKGSDNLYIKTKYVAEEFRSLCFEFDVAGLSAAQTNKGAQGSSDVDLTEVGEGHSLSMTCDNMFALIVTEQLEQAGQMRIKILKNRNGSTTDPSSFMLDMDRAKMRLSNSFSESYTQEQMASTYETKQPVPKNDPQRTKESKNRFAKFKIDLPTENDDPPF